PSFQNQFKASQNPTVISISYFKKTVSTSNHYQPNKLICKALKKRFSNNHLSKARSFKASQAEIN
ncbi:hypothetical protein HN51_047684, partial [Arachis hypogaea]